MPAAPSAVVGSAAGADLEAPPSVRVVPLSELWPGARVDDRGLVWSRTVSGLRSVLGPAFSFVLPSVAGRNGALLASIRTDDGRNLGRGGLGAALAAKKIFAVAVAGDRPLPLADPDRFSFLVYEAEKQVGANPVTSRALPEFGTAVLMQLVHQAGALPALNYRSAGWPGVGRISGEDGTGRACHGAQRLFCVPHPVHAPRRDRDAREWGQPGCRRTRVRDAVGARRRRGGRRPGGHPGGQPSLRGVRLGHDLRGRYHRLRHGALGAGGPGPRAALRRCRVRTASGQRDGRGAGFRRRTGRRLGPVRRPATVIRTRPCIPRGWSCRPTTPGACTARASPTPPRTAVPATCAATWWARRSWASPR